MSLLNQNIQSMTNPKYVTTLSDDTETAYTVLSDYWDKTLYMNTIDQLIVDVDLATGYDGQMRFGKGGVYGSPIPIKVGFNVWSDMARYGFDSVQLKNNEAGFNAAVIVQIYGI